MVRPQRPNPEIIQIPNVPMFDQKISRFLRTVSKMILFEPIWIFKAATGPAEQDQQKEPVGADLEEPG